MRLRVVEFIIKFYYKELRKQLVQVWYEVGLRLRNSRCPKADEGVSKLNTVKNIGFSRRGRGTIRDEIFCVEMLDIFEELAVQ